MEFEWDRAKAAVKLSKHGMAFTTAADFDFETTLIQSDDCRGYGEIREIALGMVRDILCQMVFTRRSNTVRIISLRRASRRERARFNAWLDECKRSDV